MRPVLRFTGLTLAGAVAAATITATPALAASPAASAPSEVATAQVVAKKSTVLRFRTAVKKLPTRAEKRSGYKRTKFKHWVDANHDCQNTRAEVLRAESKKRTTGKCTVRTGKWRSVYDNKVIRTASKLDIDHMVPLAEAWDSGARGWNASTRKAFANDLGDKRSLVAVTARTNRSKSDRDPAQWFPTKSKCAYARNWTAVKLRWGLSVNPKEKRKLTKVAKICSNVKIRYTKASIKKVSAGGSGGDGGGTGGGGGGTDRDYGTCAAAEAAGADVPYYKGKDPEYYYYRDSDSDGVVCE